MVPGFPLEDVRCPLLILDLLETLTPPQLFVATLVVGLLVGAAVLVALRLTLRRFRIGTTQFTVRDGLITGLSNIFALMVAFSASGIWNDAIQARAAVQREANALENIVALASALPDALRDEVRSEILVIGQRVVENDWPAMKRRVDTNQALLPRVNSPVVALITRLSQSAASAPTTGLLLEQLIELRSARLQREMIARGGVSPAQWSALLIVPVIALGLIVLAYHDDLSWQLLAGGVYVVAVCVALFVVLAHDRPFIGSLGVKPTPIEQAMKRLRDAPTNGVATPLSPAPDGRGNGR